MPAIASVAEFVTAMRRCDLPEQGGWEAAARVAPDPESLARELVRAGFLTAFQGRHLLAGRGDDLVLGPFLLIELLGAGGMGQVFKARHRLMGRIVALKVMLPTLGEDEAIVARFRQEVQSVARLTHPNVVTAYHADHGPRGLILAMEFCDGRDLGRAVTDGGPFPIARTCECISQAAAGLAAAHAVGLVHRDVKPSNLFLTADGTVKILDFGLARFHQEDATDRLTHTGASMGTPDFMAPEQARDSAAADIRSDVYSLGCTFYFLLTGKVPFPGGTPWWKITRHQTESPAPVESIRPEVSGELAAVVRKMMAREPADRYQTPNEVLAALVPFRTLVASTVQAVHAPSASDLPTTQPVIPHTAVLPRVVGEAGGTSVPYAVPEHSSPFAFSNTPVPISDPSTPTVGAGQGTVVNPRRPAPRSRWPVWAGAAAGLLLAAAVATVALWPPDSPRREEANAPGGQKSPELTLPEVKPPEARKPKDPGADDPLPSPAGGTVAHLPICRVAFHPTDPDTLAVARGHDWDPANGGVDLWSAKQKKAVRLLAGGKGHPPVFAVAFSRDGQYFAYAAGSPHIDTPQAAVAVYDTATWTRRCVFRTSSDGVLALAFPREGHRYLVLTTQVRQGKDTKGGGVEVWEGVSEWAEPTRVCEPVRRPAPVTGVAVNPMADFGFATSEWDRSVRSRHFRPDADPPGLVGGILFPGNAEYAPVADVAWSRDGHFVAAVTTRHVIKPADPGIRQVLLWKRAANPAAAEFVAGPESGYDFISVAFLPGGKALVTGEQGGYVRVWSVPELKPGREVKPLGAWVFGLVVSPDGQTLAAGGDAGASTYDVKFLSVAELLGK